MFIQWWKQHEVGQWWKLASCGKESFTRWCTSVWSWKRATLWRFGRRNRWQRQVSPNLWRYFFKPACLLSAVFRNENDTDSLCLPNRCNINIDEDPVYSHVGGYVGNLPKRFTALAELSTRWLAWRARCLQNKNKSLFNLSLQWYWCCCESCTLNQRKTLRVLHNHCVMLSLTNACFRSLFVSCRVCL